MKKRSRTRYELVMNQSSNDGFLWHFTFMVIFLAVLLSPQIYKQYKTNPQLRNMITSVFRN